MQVGLGQDRALEPGRSPDRFDGGSAPGAGAAADELLRAALAAAADLVGDALIVHDRHGRVVGWEGAAERLLGLPRTLALGREVAGLIVADDRPRFAESVAASGTGGSGQGAAPLRVDLLRADGSTVPALVMSRPVGDAVVGGYVTVARAVPGDDRSKQFLEHAAHQLRTPITCISACVDSMQWGTCPGESDTIIADLQRETARARRLVQSLLRVARLDEGLVVSPRRCPLAELLTDECDRTHSLRPDIDIAVRITYEVDEEPVIDGDLVREILANLLDNARRHASHEITVEVDCNREVVRFIVRDDGPGVPPEAVEQVFERFVSLDGQGGSGLGLPIARALARAHGGDLVYDDGAFAFWVETAGAVAGTAPPPA